jgi:PPP family 3-phenylpropionic acid transporter
MKTQTRFKTFFFLSLMGNGVLMPYLGLYLVNKGFTGAELALLLGALPLVKVFAQPIWGLLSDVYQIRRSILSFSLFGLAFFATLFTVMDDFSAILIALVVFSVLEAPYIPLGVTITLDYLEAGAQQDQFGLIRLWGSVGYILSTFLIGAIFIDALIDVLPFIFALVIASTGLVSLLLPDQANTQLRPNWSGSFGILTQNPSFGLFLTGTAFIGATIGISGQYLALHLQDIQAAGWLIGLAIALQPIVEVPLMAQTKNLLARFGIPVALFAGLVVLPLRWSLYALIQQPLLILPVQFLHGFTIMSMMVVGPIYVKNQLPARWMATGQALYSTAFGGIGMSFGLFVAGYVYGFFGMQAVWIACLVLSIVGLLLVSVATIGIPRLYPVKTG